MNFADKACPVVFRDSSLQQILAFEHPEAGLQLVKGRIEPGENARAAALRELQEEAGIADMAIATDLGTWHSEHKGHIWSFQLCTFTRLPAPSSASRHRGPHRAAISPADLLMIESSVRVG